MPKTRSVYTYHMFLFSLFDINSVSNCQMCVMCNTCLCTWLFLCVFSGYLLGCVRRFNHQRCGGLAVWGHQWHAHHTGWQTLCDRYGSLHICCLLCCCSAPCSDFPINNSTPNTLMIYRISCVHVHSLCTVDSRPFT